MPKQEKILGKERLLSPSFGIEFSDSSCNICDIDGKLANELRKHIYTHKVVILRGEDIIYKKYANFSRKLGDNAKYPYSDGLTSNNEF